jgi:hypothetical protein
VNVLGVYLLIGVLAIGSGWGWGVWQHHQGYVEGKTDENSRWERENAKNKAAKDAQVTAVADQAAADAAAVTAAMGPLLAIVRSGTARAQQPLKVSVVFDPKCKVGATVVDASNAGR